jgi:hypothetical protein
MKVVFAVSLLVAVATSSVSAFAPASPFVSRASRTTEIYADPKEEEGLDLDLEEMFDM